MFRLKRTEKRIFNKSEPSFSFKVSKKCKIKSMALFQWNCFFFLVRFYRIVFLTFILIFSFVGAYFHYQWFTCIEYVFNLNRNIYYLKTLYRSSYMPNNHDNEPKPRNEGSKNFTSILLSIVTRQIIFRNIQILIWIFCNK